MKTGISRSTSVSSLSARNGAKAHGTRYGFGLAAPWLLLGLVALLSACAANQRNVDTQVEPPPTAVETTVAAAPGKTVKAGHENRGSHPETETSMELSASAAEDGETPPAAAQAWSVTGTGRFVKPAAPANPIPKPGEITLNFENTDIREVVKVVLGDLLDINYILSPSVQGNATLQTGRPLQRDDLLPTLETLLRMNGAALVLVDGIYRVLPVAEAIRGTLTPQLGDKRKALPSGYNLQVVPLRYISVVEMAKILEPLAPESSVVRVDTARNLLLLAGTAREIQLLLDTIEVFDVHWIQGLSVAFFPLENVEAGDIMKDLETVFGSDAEGPLAGVLRVVPISSANGVLAVTQNPQYLQEVRQWIERLDQAAASGNAARRLFVYRVRNGEAVEMASLLTELFSDDEKGTRTTTSGSGSVAPGKTPVTLKTDDKTKNPKKTKEQPRKTASSTLQTSDRPTATNLNEDSARLSDQIKVVADETNNSLLILATPADYEKIRSALERLDIVPLQVLIEATIVEVLLEDSLQYGLQWYFNTHNGGNTGHFSHSFAGLVSNGQASTTPVFSSAGFAWSLMNNAGEVRAVLQALAEDSLVNVLSSPSVMVLDNQSARIQVGDQVPIATNSLTDTTSTNITNSIQYRDTGVVLSVTPRVNPGGLVIMEIEQEVSNVAEDTTQGINSPTIRTRNISSSIAVQSGRTVVLGGLIRDEKSNTQDGIPGLRKVPVLGWAFGTESNSKRRTELVVMLTPRVIANAEDAEDVVDDFRARLKGLEGEF